MLVFNFLFWIYSFLFVPSVPVPSLSGESLCACVGDRSVFSSSYHYINTKCVPFLSELKHHVTKDSNFEGLCTVRFHVWVWGGGILCTVRSNASWVMVTCDPPYGQNNRYDWKHYLPATWRVVTNWINKQILLLIFCCTWGVFVSVAWHII